MQRKSRFFKSAKKTTAPRIKEKLIIEAGYINWIANLLKKGDKYRLS